MVSHRDRDDDFVALGKPRVDPATEGNAQTERLHGFMKHVLADLQALEEILETDLVESGVRRIGAEQEMFLVDAALRPASINQEVLARIDDPRLTSELALFNLEANISPRTFGGGCLREMEQELDEVVRIARVGAQLCSADVLLVGILPTLRIGDLEMENMTPNPRYREMDRALSRLRGNAGIKVQIKGLDEIDLVHDNVMLESANTSFQIHFQVAPHEFARLYNLAQLISAPVLAAAANSPLLLGNRLWRETRVALFQRSVEERSTHHAARGNRPRVHFGSNWVRESVVELFREDITRYRLILAGVPEEDPLAVLAEGRPPQLSALRLHNSTVWRWNRPCYGISGDRAHLRIENRILPAGPTVLDEMANAALFFGLMSEMSDDPVPVSERLPFDDAMNNFFAAARHGLKAQFSWFEGRHLSASQLIREELLPRAADGLRRSQIDEADIERYLGVIERRVETNHTGAQWMMGSIAAWGDRVTRDVRDRTITAAMLTRQQSGQPVHEWSLAVLEESRDWRDSYRTVGQFMSTDLFTVRPDDIVDLAASMMEWEHIRHVPVEDDDGRLVGLVSHRDLLRLVSRGNYGKSAEPHLVREIMSVEPVTVAPETKTMDAVRTMRKHGVSSLPVVKQGRLLGIVTEHDLLDVAYRLLEAYLDDERRSAEH